MKSYIGRIVNLDDSEHGSFPNKEGNLINWARFVIDLQIDDPDNTLTKKRYIKVMLPTANDFETISNGKKFNDFNSGSFTFITVQEFQNNKPKKYETLVGIR